jgi:hypothetical protein
LEKAYDHVNSKFLSYLLGCFGFGTKWRKWISACITTACFSILITGSLRGFFDSSRASAKETLFHLSSPWLLWTLSVGCCLELWLGGYLSRFLVDIQNTAPLEISHLLFVNNALIMCDADHDQIYNLDHILLCFEAILGIKVNHWKSKLAAVREARHQEELGDILSCCISSLPLKYLGLPLGASFESKAIWDGVVEKMEKRLANWKKIYLSWGGRLTLLKSKLSSSPTYFLSLYPLPASIARILKRLQRDFLGLVQVVSLSFTWWTGRLSTP